MSEKKIAFIGGTGVYYQSLLEEPHDRIVETRFGSALMRQGRYKGHTVYFIARHGVSHAVPPHLVNYRANITALRQLKVDAVIATAAVGTLRAEITPGSLVLIDQFIDWTKNRPLTFFDGTGGRVVHVDYTEPYCPAVRGAVLKAAAALGQRLVDGGCYVCTEGPRFETPAEIKMIAQWGGDLVGMTNVPEVTLAREAGLCYATLALATNYAAGISENPLTHEEVLEEMARGKAALEQLLMASVEEISVEKRCRCAGAAGFWPWDEESES
ncbi:MAG: S-methyl-5'-thioadenosine phosphorylase [Bacillota bacterium]